MKYSEVRLVQSDQLYELVLVLWEYVGQKAGFGGFGGFWFLFLFSVGETVFFFYVCVRHFYRTYCCQRLHFNCLAKLAKSV